MDYDDTWGGGEPPGWKKVAAVSYVPKVGDLLKRYEPTVEHFRVGQVMPTSGDSGEPDCWLIDDDGEAADIPWPDDDWTLVARGAVPLDERPPVPERDDRPEIDRLRERLALAESNRDDDAHFAAEFRRMRDEIDRLRDERACAEKRRALDDSDPATLRAWREGCKSGAGEERARVLAVLRSSVALSARKGAWQAEEEVRNCAHLLGFTHDDLSAEREAG